MIKNINEESARALKEFRQNQIRANIRLHIIFLILIILLNFGLFIFIIIYKTKISQIKSKADKNSSSISSDKDIINYSRSQIDHKMINIVANSYGGLYHFSFIFQTSKEVDTIKNYIVEFYKEKNIILDKEKFHMNLKYQALIDDDSFSALRSKIDYNFNTFIFIEDREKKKFGFFIENVIILDKRGRYSDKENKCFLISFQKEGLFKCIGKKNKIEIKKDNDGMLIIGDGDIIIKNNYLQSEEHSGVINYPFNSFDVSTINSNIFTGKNGEFEIRELEIFSIDFV